MPTILLVDDSRVSREVLKVFLIGHHARIIEASDGAEGLRRMHEEQPDLVVADLEMPELDGLGLCEAVHADARLRKIPILILSGSLTPETTRRCRAAGALEVLAKPIQPGPLLAAVDRHLPPAPAGHAAQRSAQAAAGR